MLPLNLKFLLQRVGFGEGQSPCSLALALGIFCSAIGLGLPSVAGAQAQTVSVDASAGEVMFVAGSANQQPPTGVARSVVKGLKLAQGDVIRTGSDAYVYVRMADAGLLVVRPQSELRIDRWSYDAQRPELSEIKYTLQSGVARYVSGRGSQAAKDKFRFNTSLAAIGVRGTDFTVLAQPNLTQVSVRSGSIIMGSLGSGCKTEGIGPCEGEGTIELLAAQRDKLLQVSLGDQRPRVVDSSTAGGPDKARPPASGEPRADSGSSTSGSTLVTEAAREAAVTDLVVVSSAPQLPIAVWGRWGALASADEGTAVVQQVLKDRQLAGINRYYVLGANPTAVMELPNVGVGRFGLTAHDGFLVDPTTGKTQETTASNGVLQIDFGARRFNTSLDLQSATVKTSIQSQGYIEDRGKMVSDAFVSPTAVEGLVGGKGGSDAVYLYYRPSNQGIEVSGAASWKK